MEADDGVASAATSWVVAEATMRAVGKATKATKAASMASKVASEATNAYSQLGLM